MAIAMGFSGTNKKFKAEACSKQDLQMLETTCAHFLKTDDNNDIQRRLQVISQFVDLMVFDLPNKAGGVDEVDFEECLGEFMLHQFNVEGDDESIEQISKILIKVRKELTATAMDDQTLWSQELERLR
jgi:hypothetical protein